MDFVDWCTIVLKQLTDLVRQSPNAAQFGVTQMEIGAALSGVAGGLDQARSLSISEALSHLENVDLIENEGLLVKVTRRGRELAGDLTSLWEAICSHSLDENEEAALRLINQLRAYPIRQAQPA